MTGRICAAAVTIGTLQQEQVQKGEQPSASSPWRSEPEVQ
jgi:hypothetical protein